MDRWILRNIQDQINRLERQKLVSSCKPMVSSFRSTCEWCHVHKKHLKPKNCLTAWHQITRITRASEYKHILVMVHSKQPHPKQGFTILCWEKKHYKIQTFEWLIVVLAQLGNPIYKNHQHIQQIHQLQSDLKWFPKWKSRFQPWKGHPNGSKLQVTTSTKTLVPSTFNPVNLPSRKRRRWHQSVQSNTCPISMVVEMVPLKGGR